MNNNRSTCEHEVAGVEISERRLSLTTPGEIWQVYHREGKIQDYDVVEIDLFNAEGERVNRLTLFGVDGDKIKIKRNKTRYIK